MPTQVVMPQMGESIAEGTITKWLVKVGDKVERDQPLFEISTDKVDAEIPSPAAGKLLEIKFPEGSTVAVNAVVAVIGEEGEQPAAAPAAAAQPAAAQPAAAQPAAAQPAEPKAAAAAPAEAKPAAAGAAAETKAAPPPEESPSDVAETQRVPSMKGQKSAEEVVVKQAVASSPDASGAQDEAAAPPPSGGGLGDRVRTYSSPLVRNIAAQEGVDLSQVQGTGAHGRVTKQDILSHLEQRQKAGATQPMPTAAAAPAAPSAPAPAATGGGGGLPEFQVAAYRESDNVEIEPMSKIRQITAAHMVYSKRTSAHVTTVFHIDFSRIDAIRKKARKGFEAAHGTKLTYMPFIFKAVAQSLRAHKKVNASIDGTNVVFKKDINLGMAVALDWGLIVPVIKHADQLNLAGLAKAANDLADRARAKKLKPEEVQGGTFTITNPGVFGSLFGTPIINQPQVAILGIGTIEKRPKVITDADGLDSIAIRVMSYFGITYDHRLVDGADADHFMNAVKKVLEEDPWSELEPFVQA